MPQQRGFDLALGLLAQLRGLGAQARSFSAGFIIN